MGGGNVQVNVEGKAALQGHSVKRGERQRENLSAARTGREARRASEIPKPENFDELTDMNTWAGASQEANLVQCIEGVKISSS